MKTLLIIFAVFAVTGMVICDSTEEKLNELLDKVKSKTLQKYIKDSSIIDNATAKLEEFCPGSASKIMDGISSLASCAENTADTLTVCVGVRTQMLKCTEDLIKAIDECMPPAAKGLPNLMIKSFVSSFNYSCGLSGEEFFELFNDCLQPDEDNETEMKKCKTSLESKVQGLRSEPSPSKICRFAHDAKPCFQSYMKTSCINEVTRNTYNGMFDAIVAPCSDINEVKN